MKPGDIVMVQAEVISANDASNIVLKAGGTHFVLPASALIVMDVVVAGAGVAGAGATRPEPTKRQPKRRGK